VKLDGARRFAAAVVARRRGHHDVPVGVDRVGRPGRPDADVRAIGYSTDASGLPTRYLLFVSPETGEVVGAEEVLTGDTGKLGVTAPAVISYESFSTASDPVPHE
jgi:hypothetical protein